MKDDPKERWLELCELASKEQDPNKLIALVTEINQLLEEKEDRLYPKRDSVSAIPLVVPSCRASPFVQ